MSNQTFTEQEVQEIIDELNKQITSLQYDKEKYAKWCVDLMEGDDYMLDEIYKYTSKDGYTDEDGFWICED